MKRGWIGLVFLLVLLGCSIAVTWAMDARHEPVADHLEEAAELALEGEWDRALVHAGAAQKAWEKTWHFTASFADHEPMEEIDGLFAQVEIYAKGREELSFAAVCADLARRLEAMGEAHGFLWWNIL